jgi:hypothetical protein
MTGAAASARWFFHFGQGEAEGDESLRELLGGKLRVAAGRGRIADLAGDLGFGDP